VVDNGSTDGTAAMVKKDYPEVDLIRLESNRGFAAAVNEGVEQTEGDYFALLNNDVEVEEGWLEALVGTLESHREYAACAPKSLNFFQRRRLDGAGDEINIVGQAKSRGYGEEDRGQYDRGEEVFAVSAGASLYRRSVWEKVGPFAEEYFAYFEDLDWCFRARLAGHRFYYQPKAVVYHRHKATSARDPGKLAYLTFRNTTLTMLGNFPGGLFVSRYRWLKIPLVHLNTIWYLGRSGKLIQALAADFWILRHLGWLWRRRGRIQRQRAVSVEEIDRWMEPKPITFWGLFS
jgi:hypothetical protein